MDRHILLIDDYTDNDDPPIAIDTSPWQQHSSSRQTSKISIQEPSCGVAKCRAISFFTCLFGYGLLLIGLLTSSWYHEPRQEILGLWRHSYRNYSVIYPDTEHYQYSGDNEEYIFTYTLKELDGWLRITALLMISAAISGGLTIAAHIFMPIVPIITCVTGTFGIFAMCVFGQGILSRVPEENTRYFSWSFHAVVLANLIYLADGVLVLGWCLVSGRLALQLPVWPACCTINNRYSTTTTTTRTCTVTDSNLMT